MKWLATLLIVCSFMFSDVLNMDVSQFNANLSKLVKLIHDGNTTGSEELLKELANAAQECDFGVSEKKEKNHNYISPYLSELPDALKYKKLQEIDDKIREEYHKTIQQINEANQKIAVKKYFTALKILITGFQTYKSTIDLIKTDYSLKELLELPSNLSQTVEQYKQDAENIKAKFDSIKSEKEKLQYLVDFKNALWSLVQKIRSMKSFLLTHKYYLTKLDKSIGYCNDGIKWINEEVFLPMPNDGDSSADVTSYDRELSEIKNGLTSKHITVEKYVNTRDGIKNSVHNICSKVSECNVGDITKQAENKCYTRDPAILECLKDDELEENVTYYDTVLKINNGKTITPTPFDFYELKSYVNNYNNYLELKDRYINKFQELIQLIDNTDFLMSEGNYTVRPITLDPVYVKDELSPLIDGKLPSECNSQWDDDNMSVSYVGQWYDGSGSLTIFDKTPSSGPNVFDIGYVYNYSNSKIPSIWYNDMKYEDKVKKEADDIFGIAYTGYANKPRCTYSMLYNHCYYTIALFNESKMRDMQHNIYLLVNDLDDYKSDLKELSHDLLNIKNKADELLSLYNQLLRYQSSLDLKDIDFYINLNSLKFYVFMGSKYGIYQNLEFVESYNLLDLISSIYDIFESKIHEIKKHIYITKDEIYKQYIDPIDSTFSFNVKLKNSKEDINETCTSLRQYSYKDKLNSLYDSISSIIWDLKNGRIKDIYNEANSMKSKYNEIINLPLNEIASNLKKIDGYFKLIKDGSRMYNIFKGDNLVFKENQNIVNNMTSVYWPACNHTFSNENIINKYFNYNELKNNLPKVKAFIDRYTSDAYKPKPPTPSQFILEEAKMTPPAIYGPHKVEFTLKFKNVNHTYWGRCYFDLVTVMESGDYEFESVEGYNPIYYDSYGNEHRDHYYTTPNKEGIVKFALNIKDDNFGDVPLKSILVHAYMTSDEIRSWSFDGENVNAKMFEIKDIKNDKDLDTNGDHIADSWENRYNIADINTDDDNDGLSNKEEYLYGSDPLKVDSDGDGIDDATEIKYGLDPSLSFDAQADNDNDGISNKEEILNGYDPNSANSPAKKVYENIDNINGKKFDLNLYAVSDANLSNISISFDFTEGFTLLDAKSDSYTLDSDSRTIEIDNLPSGTTKVATITFENDNLQEDFTFKCSSDTIFCSNLKSNFLFATFEYNLNKGWNLIDNPYDTNLSLSNFDNCDVVWQYDKEWKAYSKKFEKTLKEFNITQIDTLPAKNGAWVYCNEDQNIHTTNLNIQNSLFKSLNEGWNLVGIKLNIGANDIFTIYPDAKMIWSWKNGIWSYAINSDEFNSTLQNIDKNSAIWIKKE